MACRKYFGIQRMSFHDINEISEQTLAPILLPAYQKPLDPYSDSEEQLEKETKPPHYFQRDLPIHKFSFQSVQPSRNFIKQFIYIPFRNVIKHQTCILFREFIEQFPCIPGFPNSSYASKVFQIDPMHINSIKLNPGGYPDTII